MRDLGEYISTICAIYLAYAPSVRRQYAASGSALMPDEVITSHTRLLSQASPLYNERRRPREEPLRVARRAMRLTLPMAGCHALVYRAQRRIL